MGLLKRIKQTNLDPLYIIFEQHLYNFQDCDADRDMFAKKVVDEYISFLRRQNLAVPARFEAHIVDELSAQVRQMLLKKIYGCLSIEEFRRGLTRDEKKKARSQYSRIQNRARSTKSAKE